MGGCSIGILDVAIPKLIGSYVVVSAKSKRVIVGPKVVGMG